MRKYVINEGAKYNGTHTVLSINLDIIEDGNKAMSDVSVEALCNSSCSMEDYRYMILDIVKSDIKAKRCIK